MQVNRLSLGLQEALKTASNFNTARSETLFDKEKFGVSEENGEDVNFANLNIEDLNITSDQISNLLGMFADEVIAVFSGNLPDMFEKDQNNPDSPKKPTGIETPQQQTPTVFTA